MFREERLSFEKARANIHMEGFTLNNVAATCRDGCCSLVKATNTEPRVGPEGVVGLFPSIVVAGFPLCGLVLFFRLGAGLDASSANS